MKTLCVFLMLALLLCGCAADPKETTVPETVPSDVPVDDPVDAPVVEPVDDPVDVLPVDNPVVEPVDDPVDVLPVDNPVVEPVDDPVTLPDAYELTADDAIAYNDFSLRLARECMQADDSENMMLSPLSVLSALSMTANGADGETLQQMEDALGFSLDDLNRKLGGWSANLPSLDGSELHTANSIWYRTGAIDVVPDFLTVNRNCWSAEVRASLFDDAACKEINGWVNDKTKGMIPSILDEIPENAVLYLINALAFDARWQTPYEDRQLSDGTFTAADGTEVPVTMMHSTELCYISDDSAAGFIKYYDGYDYAFAAILPNESVTPREYLASLSSDGLYQLLKRREDADVIASLPQFESDYTVSLRDTLKSLGITDAFSEGEADFTKMGTSPAGNIYVNDVLHKTFVSVDAVGTKAAAVTAVECPVECVRETYEVTLDRPFIYVIMDPRTSTPIFLGILDNPAA